MAIAAANFVHPYWTRLRAVLRLVADLGGAAIFCWLLKAHLVASIVAPNLTSAKALEITNAANYWMDKVFPMGVVVGAIVLGCNAYRVWRAKPSNA
jgi:hypothetical protein